MDNCFGLLMIDNLRRKKEGGGGGVVIMGRCCMFKNCCEMIHHLLLHCVVARELWLSALSSFVVHWVMPWTALDMFASWKERFSCQEKGDLGCCPSL